MKINLEDLKNQPNQELNVSIHIDQLDDVAISETVTGILNLTVLGNLINIKGKLKTQVILDCNRCLKSFDYPLIIDVQEDFLFGKLVDSQTKEYELFGENFVEDLEEKQEIDLTEFIYQEIILNIPSQKLCDLACEGTEEYKKVKKENLVDPRLAIFKQLSEEN